jgi:hypothetical protein
MGLYVLKENEQDLMQMGFEQILSFITEKPKFMLSEYTTPGNNDTILYQELKKSLRGNRHLTFILGKLEKEFKDSLEAANQIRI